MSVNIDNLTPGQIKEINAFAKWVAEEKQVI